jgi:antitoxin component YwqK of YwqJK toxin-antitoxin module
MKTFILVAFMLTLGLTEPINRTYHRTYHDNGKLASEGWLRFNVKDGYWKFYHDNGRISQEGHFAYGKRNNYWYFYNKNRVRTKEGHYEKGEQVNWWLFYDIKGRVNHKCQLNMGVKDGYCLKYENKKLISAEKYSNGEKIKEWTNFGSFRKENSLSDLK